MQLFFIKTEFPNKFKIKCILWFFFLIEYTYFVFEIHEVMNFAYHCIQDAL